MKCIFSGLLSICCLFAFSQKLDKTLLHTKQTTSTDFESLSIGVSHSEKPIASESTGTSAEVGVTQGNLSVSLTGGALYEIPIVVPVGINEVTPQVSLTYNSQSGNGLAGYGWHISGISVISRIPATQFHDGVIDAVDFDATDRYSLDGQRLIVKNGTSGVYGANEAVYETESYSNIRITSYGVHTDGAMYGPSHFRVDYPDGSYAVYGNGGNSRSKTDWAISYWQNPQGVRISYHYILSNNNLSISSIKYGSKFSETPINEISFVYKTRQRAEQAYICGENFVRNTILSEIQVKSNNVGFRNYELKHETTSLGYELLKSITEKNGDKSKVLNPTVFNYEVSAVDDLFHISDPITLGIGKISSKNGNYLSGDFNADGAMDFIIYPTLGIDTKRKFWIFTELQYSDFHRGSAYTVGPFTDIFPTTWLNRDNKLMPGQGWCVVQFDKNSNTATFKNYSTLPSTPVGFQYQKTFEFPKFVYESVCGGMSNCELDELPLDPTLKTTAGKIEASVEETSYCPDPIAIHIDLNIDNQTTLIWEYAGETTPVMWEVYYFESGTAETPKDDDLIGIYLTTFTNSLIIGELDLGVDYDFYIRSVCINQEGMYQTGSWQLYKQTTASGKMEFVNPVEIVHYAIPKYFLSGDFNGDGLTDVLAVDKKISYQEKVCPSLCYTIVPRDLLGGKTYFVDLDRRKTESFVNYVGDVGNINSDSRLAVADINGDSKSDLFVFNKNKLLVYSLDAQNQLVLLVDYTDDAIKYNMPFYMGDFNGDGKSDFVIPQEIKQDSWSFFLSKGNGFEKITTSIGIGFYADEYGYFAVRGFHLNTYSLAEYSYIVNDFNGDGKSDILYQKNITKEFIMTRRGPDFSQQGEPQATSLILFENRLSTNTNITFNKVTTNPSFRAVQRNPLPIFLDHKSVSKGLEYSLITDNSVYSFRSTKDNKKDTSLKEIVLGNGLKQVITYQSLDRATTVYEPSVTLEVYPNLSIQTANNFKVVSQLEQVSQTEYKKQLFRYYAGVSHAQGLGFLGFKEQYRTSWFNDETPAITSITKYDISKRGAVSEVFSLAGAIHTFNFHYPEYITKTELVNEATLLPNKVFKLQNKRTKLYNQLEQTSKDTQVTFDNFGNPTQIKTSYFDSPTLEGTKLIYRETKKIEYQNNLSSGMYYVGRPKKVQNVNEIIEVDPSIQLLVPIVKDTYSTEELYSYSSNQLLTKIQKKGHQTDYLTEDNEYDAYGNITKKTITAQGLAPRVTEYTYDATGRFLTSSKDIEGQVTTYVYNTYTGNLIQEKQSLAGSSPISTTYGYDTWGNKIEVIDYLGKRTRKRLFKHPKNNTQTVVNTSSDSGLHLMELYNQLGQKTASMSKDISGNQWSTQLFEYTIHGEVTKQSEPFFVTTPLDALSATQWNTTTYDPYRRIIAQDSYTGKTTTIHYNGLVVTTDDGTKTTQVTKNAVGHTTSVTDLGGTIYYKYFANGNLKESNFEGLKVTIEQNGWGQKTKLTDPSAGVYTYQYNNFGELIKESTPKGETNYSLDNFGRLIYKTIVGDNTHSQILYRYHPTTKLLVQVNHTDNADPNQTVHTVYNYSYDNYKRLISEQENNGSVLFQKKYHYDSFGRIDKEELKAIDLASSQFSENKVVNTYKNGYHWQIIDANTNKILWQTNHTDPRGQLIQALLGNGVQINHTYDQYGQLQQIKHQKNDGVNPINMVLTTSFDPQKGHLLNRTNNLFSWSEDLQYDNLDRLTHYKNDSNNIVAQAYDNKGRITENISGTYTYDNNTNRNTSIQLTEATKAAHQLREGLFYDTMESQLGWQKNDANVTYDTTFYNNQFGGTTSLKIVNTSSNQEKIVHSEVWIPINNSEPTQYTYSAWIYSDGPQAEIFLIMKTADETGYMTLADKKASNVVGTWHYVEKTVTIPAHIRYINFRVDNNGKKNGGTTIWYDDVKIRKTANTPTDSFTDRHIDINYNTFKAPVTIYEPGIERFSFSYNTQGQRSVMYYGGLEENKQERPLQKYYSADGSMEVKRNIKTGEVVFVTYIGGDGYTAPAIYKKDNTSASYLYLHRDYQSTIVAVSNAEGQLIEKRLFDAWGKVLEIRDKQGRRLSSFEALDRGYTGHEHLQSLGIIHMNGRLYDATLHRFLQPDNYIQNPFNTQNYNRYGYCLNNPFMYTDPSGEEFISAVIIGAIIGAYMGGVIANNGQYNPVKWDYNNGTTWGYMLGGAVVGGLSGWAGSAIASSGISMANTLGIAGSSLINSTGTHIYTGGKTDISISFGVASYNFTQGEFGYLGKKGNSSIENLGYGLGALANLADINQLMNSTKAILYTDDSDFISHSAIVDDGGNVLMSYGPNDAKVPDKIIGYASYFRRSTSDYTVYPTLPVDITVNKNIFTLTRGLGKILPFQGLTINCVNMASLSLWLNGIPNIGLHPYLLYATTWAYSTGIRPDLFSYYLINKYKK